MAKTIRQLREERGWSQDDLAMRLGVSQSAVAKWELGRVPSEVYQQRLAALFGVPVEAIAFWPPEQPPQETSQHGMG